jgi:hypothetical protein
MCACDERICPGQTEELWQTKEISVRVQAAIVPFNKVVHFAVIIAGIIHRPLPNQQVVVAVILIAEIEGNKFVRPESK